MDRWANPLLSHSFYYLHARFIQKVKHITVKCALRYSYQISNWFKLLFISLMNRNKRRVKVCFTQKILVKLSHCHSSEPFFAPGLLFPVNGMNNSDKMSIFSFFCINQINLLKLIQICTHVIINNFIALQAL